MRIFLCDDEPKILSDLSRKVQECLPESEIVLYESGEALLCALRTEKCDILLLDIDMPGMSGLDIAKEMTGLASKPLLVFVTSHDELVYDSLFYHPFGFIRKSYLNQELPKILEDCKRELSSREKHFCFHQASGDVRLNLQEILYFEADGNYLKVITEKESFRFRETLTSVENALSDSGFVRVHKGFLVNQVAVKILESTGVELVNGDMIPFGRMYIEEAKEKLMRWIMR